MDWLCDLVDDLLDWASEHPYVCALLFILLFLGGVSLSLQISIGVIK